MLYDRTYTGIEDFPTGPMFAFYHLLMPFTDVVNVYSDMSLSKGHLGSRGGKHLKTI